uniref:Uncharacterized protein n=1 Tax=Cannabis sativa TaxID=3483 RepID=A0A803QSM1_CANSA
VRDKELRSDLESALPASADIELKLVNGTWDPESVISIETRGQGSLDLDSRFCTKEWNSRVE